ncbi:MAG: pyruvate formate lyase family protein, partial [Bacteroidales bacterium]|nr:pyruvate formate lyase family protein [Bacteroidales bacterium]
MNKRIQNLRQLSLDAVPAISAERAILITEYYQKYAKNQPSVAIQRAEAFRYLLKKKEIYVHELEIIVGERGSAPKATPTYPEISLHSLDDLRMLDQREKVSFKVDKTTFETYKDQIIPFWEGRTQRDRLFAAMSENWIKAYQAGVFTEFQEQRAPGHTVAGKRLFSMGLLDIIEEIKQVKQNKSASEIDQNHWQELEAMQLVAEAMIAYAKRHVEALETLLQRTTDPARGAELEEIIEVCKRVPAHAPQTFHEMLQHYWFIHVGIISELNPWDSFNPGRLDQHLWPFYQKEMAAGTLSRDRAKELLQAFWIKFNNHPAPPKVGVTALESNTYTDFALINLGGLTDKGFDAVNDLSYLILDVIEEMRLLQPSSMVQISKKNSDRFIKRALQIVKT